MDDGLRKLPYYLKGVGQRTHVNYLREAIATIDSARFYPEGKYESGKPELYLIVSGKQRIMVEEVLQGEDVIGSEEDIGFLSSMSINPGEAENEPLLVQQLEGEEVYVYWSRFSSSHLIAVSSRKIGKRTLKEMLDSA